MTDSNNIATEPAKALVSAGKPDTGSRACAKQRNRVRIITALPVYGSEELTPAELEKARQDMSMDVPDAGGGGGIVTGLPPGMIGK